MSKLDELIADLCPNGVRYYDLEKVCEISKGIQFNKADMQEEGTYPVINGGINPSGYIEQFNQSGNTVTISQGGASAGYVNWIETNFWAGAHCYVLNPTQKVLNRYLFHFVKGQERKLQECQYGAGIPALGKATVAALQIPVPPLEVQHEIVRILDTFMGLVEELTTELISRKKQYDYYRDEILYSSECIEYALQDICQIVDCPHTSPKWQDSGIPVIRNYNLVDGVINTATLSYVDEVEYQNRIKRIEPKEGDIMFSREAPIGNVGIVPSNFKCCQGQRVVLLRSDKDYLVPEFLLHALQGVFIRKQIENVEGKGATVSNFNIADLKKLKVRIPSLSEQANAVCRLNSFWKLNTDIIYGLPAEITARQKQYDYYREELLSFRRVGLAV